MYYSEMMWSNMNCCSDIYFNFNWKVGNAFFFNFKQWYCLLYRRAEWYVQDPHFYVHIQCIDVFCIYDFFFVVNLANIHVLGLHLLYIMYLCMLSYKSLRNLFYCVYILSIDYFSLQSWYISYVFFALHSLYVYLSI